MCEVYYKTLNTDDTLKDVIKKEVNNVDIVSKDMLTAKKAREMTNNAIIERVKLTLKEIEKVAKNGSCEYNLKISKSYDYKFAISYFEKILGYKLSFKCENSEALFFTVNW